MTKAILLTQCLQNDFVKPLARHAQLPNRLHIGAAEALRLMGEEPDQGPVARMMQWAYEQTPEELMLIHIRDCHSQEDPLQQDHLRQFGPHCLAGTDGAEDAFAVPAKSKARPVDVRSLTLNDFQGTALADVLSPVANQTLNAGIMGVWTEAKVFFLAYELRTRYPNMTIGVCSALTASSSRSQHFMALEQLRRLLGVHIYDSVGDFIEFLGGEPREVKVPGLHEGFPAVQFESGALSPVDEQLLRYLFRNCRSLKARLLDGGFSGNAVLGTSSIDLLGHEQVVHVVKIGPRHAMGQERTAFERIEDVLGNNAPRISDFADQGDRGAVKYRYASMSGSSVMTFQKKYMQGAPLDKIGEILHTVFVEQLGRLYVAAEPESVNLLDYYEFSPKWAASVRQKVENLLGAPADGETIQLECGTPLPNLCRFYEVELAKINPLRRDYAFFTYVHGDLNGANIILDGHENVWLIDFFHTHRGHVLRDLIKLENDILYIFTQLPDAEALELGMRFSDFLLSVEDLGVPLPPVSETLFEGTRLERAYETLRILRSFYPGLIHTSRSPLQWLIAAMRYAVHTLSFDESSHRQKLWALYTASLCGEKIIDIINRQKELTIDRIDTRYTGSGTLGLTILPGRKDYGRDLALDLESIKKNNVTDIVCLLSGEELDMFGVPDLLHHYRAAGLTVYHLPILDQKTCSVEEMRKLILWMQDRLNQGAGLLLHCVGGLGRSGFVAACWLRFKGLSASEATAEVRRVRSARAIESRAQEAFVRNFTMEHGQ